MTDAVIFGTELAAAIALTLMTRGRLGYDLAEALEDDRRRTTTLT